SKRERGITADERTTKAGTASQTTRSGNSCQGEDTARGLDRIGRTAGQDEGAAPVAVPARQEVQVLRGVRDGRAGESDIAQPRVRIGGSVHVNRGRESDPGARGQADGDQACRRGGASPSGAALAGDPRDGHDGTRLSGAQPGTGSAESGTAGG